MTSAAPVGTLADNAAPAAPAPPASDAKPKPKKGAGGFKTPPELQPKPGETPEEKIARLRALAEAAKRASGKA